MILFLLGFSPVFSSDQTSYGGLDLEDTNTIPRAGAQTSLDLSPDKGLYKHLQESESKIKIMEKEHLRLLSRNTSLEHRLEVCDRSLSFFMQEYQRVAREKFELSCIVSNLTQGPVEGGEENHLLTKHPNFVEEKLPEQPSQSSKLFFGLLKQGWDSFALWIGSPV